MSNSLEAFRENLVEILEKRDITLTQITEDLGMSRASLSHVIHGHNGISLERADRIADYLDIPLSRLLRIREKVG